MFRAKGTGEDKVIVDITGPAGNAFCLMGFAKRWANQLGKDFDPILADMKSGDYEHLLEVLEREFGEYIIFER